jgi:FtsP/CotA-like multicopper oxidase with cupredoxin domain
MDGGPKNKIAPNTSWSAIYRVNQEASTNWYHPHLMGKTAEHVYMGLAGVIIVDSNESDALNIPKTYGVDDIPLILQDKRFDVNHQIDYSPTMMEIRRGYTSETMLANGVITPHIDVRAKKIRFRVVNGSNARVYKLAFSDGRDFQQIATDNSFLESPVFMNELLLSVGERAEIVVDFKDDIGKDVILRDLNSGLDIMKINVSDRSNIQNPLPQKLTTHLKLNVNDAVRTRQFRLGMSRINGQMHMSINGKTMDMNRIDEVVPVNDIEIWEISNMMGMEHNFHIHATHFYIIQRDGSPSNVLENEKGYKDVVRLAPNSSVKVIVKMTDFVDEKNGYMYHCHFLEHEDDGMMGQFTVSNGKVAINVGGSSGGMGGMNTPNPQ